MTTPATPAMEVAAHHQGAPVLTGRLPFRWVVADAITLTKRNLLRYLRLPNLIVFSFVQPIMFVLLLSYVFGGAIRNVPGKYINFLMPGIFIQTAIFGATNTGVGLAEDMLGGLVDRFHSLPMARSAVLAGRTLSDGIRNAFVVVLMTAVGFLVGFRFHNGFFGAVGGLVAVVIFGHCFSWISAWVGLMAKNVETAQSAGFVWVFPLTFASSVFVPVNTMPGWLQAIARVNPVSNATNAVRGLCESGPVARPVLYSAAWCVAILMVFVPLAVARYRRVS